jgi:hypothetical protein
MRMRVQSDKLSSPSTKNALSSGSSTFARHRAIWSSVTATGDVVIDL